MYNFFTDEKYLMHQLSRECGDNSDHGFGPGNINDIGLSGLEVFHLTSLHRKSDKIPAGDDPPVIPICPGRLIACPVYNFEHQRTTLNPANLWQEGFGVEDVNDYTGSNTGNPSKRMLEVMNLVLKPSVQPPFPFPKIKYIIYRNVKVSSFTDLSGLFSFSAIPIPNTYTKSRHGIAISSYEGVIKDNTGSILDPTPANDPLAYAFLNVQHDKRIADVSPVQSFGQEYSSNFSGITDNALMDEVFARGYGVDILDGSVSASGGSQYLLGTFADEFGIEIVVENQYYNLTVGAVRKKMTAGATGVREDKKNNTYIYINSTGSSSSTAINAVNTLNPPVDLRTKLSSTGVYTENRDHVAKFKTKLFKEQVLQYVDPCALFGSFTMAPLHQDYKNGSQPALRTYNARAFQYEAVAGVNIYRRLLFGLNIIQEETTTATSTNIKIVRNGESNYTNLTGTIELGRSIDLVSSGSSTIDVLNYYLPANRDSMRGIFANRNKVYVDIRDNYGSSYNLFNHKRTTPAAPEALYGNDLFLGHDYPQDIVTGLPSSTINSVLAYSDFKESSYHVEGYDLSLHKWPVLRLESVDILNGTSTVTNSIKPHYIPRVVSDNTNTGGNANFDKVDVLVRELFRSGSYLERHTMLKFRIQFPIGDDSDKERHLIQTPLIKETSTTNIDDQLYKQIDLQGQTTFSTTEPIQLTDSNYYTILEEAHNVQHTPDVILYLAADYPGNIMEPGGSANEVVHPASSLTGAVNGGGTSFGRHPDTGVNAMFITPICAYYSMTFVNMDVEITAPDPNNMAENAALHTIGATKHFPGNAPLFPGFHAYEFLDNIFKPARLYQQVSRLAQNLPTPFGGAPALVADLYENATHVISNRVSGRDMLGNIGVAIDNVTVSAGTVNYDMITFFASQFDQDNTFGLPGNTSTTFRDLSEFNDTQNPLQIPFHDTADNFMEYLNNLSSRSRTSNAQTIRIESIPNPDTPTGADIYYINHGANIEPNDAFVFLNLSKQDFDTILQVYNDITSASTSSAPTLLENSNGILGKWISLAFVFDQREEDDHHNEVADYSIPRYSRYKVCLRGFAIDEWVESSKANYRLVERLIDTGVSCYFANPAVNLDNTIGTTIHNSPDHNPSSGDINRSFDLIQQSATRPGSSRNLYHLLSKMYLVRDIHMSRKEFYDYHKYFKHNIEKVWTSHNPDWNDMLPSNEGFEPKDANDNLIDVLTKLVQVQASAITFNVLNHTESITAFLAGAGRSHQLGRSITMYFTPDELTRPFNDFPKGALSSATISPKYTSSIYNEYNLNLSTISSIYDSNTPAHEFGHLIGLADRYAYLAYKGTNLQIDGRRGGGYPFHYVDFGSGPTSDQEYNENYNWHHNLMTMARHLAPQDRFFYELVQMVNNGTTTVKISEREYINAFWNNYPKPIFSVDQSTTGRFTTSLPSSQHQPTPVDIITLFITQMQWRVVFDRVFASTAHEEELTHPNVYRTFILEGVPVLNNSKPEDYKYTGIFIGHDATGPNNSNYWTDHNVLSRAINNHTDPITVLEVTESDYNNWLSAVVRNDLNPSASPVPIPSILIQLSNIASRAIVPNGTASIVGHVHLANNLTFLYPANSSRTQIENPGSGLLIELLDRVMEIRPYLLGIPTSYDESILSGVGGVGTDIWNYDPSEGKVSVEVSISGPSDARVMNTTPNDFNIPEITSFVDAAGTNPIPSDIDNFSWVSFLIELDRRLSDYSFPFGDTNLTFQQYVNRYWLMKLAATSYF